MIAMPGNMTRNQGDLDRWLGIPGLRRSLCCSTGKIFTNLNVELIHGTTNDLRLPSGFDVYVLGFFAEKPDPGWFYRWYQKYPKANWILLSDLDLGDISRQPRIETCRLLHWNWFIGQAKAGTRVTEHVPKYKISSFSHDTTQYRYFITAHLWSKPEALVKWHNEQSLHDHDFFFDIQDRPKLRALIDLKNDIRASTDVYKNFSYVDSVVNCINETIDISWSPDVGKWPSPFMSDKTWQPLIQGNALIFSCQHGIKETLEHAGFRFEYPWSQAYASVPGDLDRLEALLDTLDEILSMPMSQLISGVKHSVEHNQRLIFSDQLQEYIKTVNLQGLSKLRKLLT